MNGGMPPQSAGVTQEPREAAAAESDTASGEPFFVGAYQVPEGDTETRWFYLPPQGAWAQLAGSLAVSAAPAEVGTAGLHDELAEWWSVTAAQLARLHTEALLRA